VRIGTSLSGNGLCLSHCELLAKIELRISRLLQGRCATPPCIRGQFPCSLSLTGQSDDVMYVAG